MVAMRKIMILTTLVAVLLLPLGARAAETVHLFLKSNGVDMRGESTKNSLGRKDSIECLSFESAVSTARDAASGQATGRRQYQPIVIRKRIDKSSPLLMKALTNNEVISGDFRFYRPSSTGDGTTEHFYSVAIKGARVASVRLIVPDTTDPKSASLPPMEEVTFVFQSITWTFTNGGVTHEDEIKAVLNPEQRKKFEQ
jgi:type VI secretion system secreted protein Hcp